jgi:hypothetical protein
MMCKQFALKIEKLITGLFYLLYRCTPKLKYIALPTYMYYMAPTYNKSPIKNKDVGLTIDLNSTPYTICQVKEEPPHGDHDYLFAAYNKLNILRLKGSYDDQSYNTLELHYEIIYTKDTTLTRKTWSVPE